MKDDKDLLKSLLQAKFKSDSIIPSKDRFDDIYNAVQEQKVKRNYVPWYEITVIAILLCAVFILYYVMNDTTSEKTDITPSHKENIDSIESKNDQTIIQTKEQPKTIEIKPVESNTDSKPIKTVKTEIFSIDATILEPDEESKEKGFIGVSYIASEKYASTKSTKYIKLPDSSMMVMRKNSKVNFHTSIQSYRRVDLIGTIFFSIQKNESKPFVIHGKHCNVQVSGNSFAIATEKDADYITLIEGSAEIIHRKTGKKQNVVSGQSFSINSQEIILLKRSPNQFARKTGALHYENTSVSQIIHDLGENFDAKIRLKRSPLLDCKYNGSFSNATTEKVLGELAKKLNIKIEKEGEIFIIIGEGNCAN
ncbi:FecR family protein [Aquimarina sp. MAR_2010_214]|uniref:FecR family protein n=1 Tax=Aquimarina sp. MAR_2010_214 TaxID=1250026 RepID=UPI000C7078AD|nr:FecR family protein [Aquimarina sp. MAR_2010_214]PKV49769.1 FecR family protein [Aquimarina sp. MAR_2010_214]